MDEQLTAAVEAQDDDLEQATCGIEAGTELPSKAVVVQVTREDRVLSGTFSLIRGDAVSLRRGVNSYPT